MMSSGDPEMPVVNHAATNDIKEQQYTTVAQVAVEETPERSKVIVLSLFHLNQLTLII